MLNENNTVLDDEQMIEKKDENDEQKKDENNIVIDDVVENIIIENILVPIKIKKNLLPQVYEKLSYKTEEDINIFTKEKKYHDNMINGWVDDYGFEKTFLFENAYTGLIKIDDIFQIFFLYFVEKENENFYIEITLNFSTDVKNLINEIFFVILKK